MTDTIKFSCKTCGETVAVETDGNPPDDEDIIRCLGCGREFGTYAEVREGMRALAKAEIDRVTEKHLGVKPTWKKS